MDRHAYRSMRDALEWIAAARSNAGFWSPEDFERFAREAMSRAAEALRVEHNAAQSRR